METATQPQFTLGDWLKKARTGAGLSQEKLAELVGVTQIMVSRWENDKYEPRLSEMRRVAEICDAPYLLHLEALPWAARDSNPEPAGSRLDRAA